MPNSKGANVSIFRFMTIITLIDLQIVIDWKEMGCFFHNRWCFLAALGLWPPGLQLERPWGKVGIFLLSLALPSSLTLPFLTFFPAACPSSRAPCSHSAPFPWCLCLPEDSMAHRHRSRQPWQVELAGSAAMHDTPCDCGMPTLWNQNEHQVSLHTWAFTLTSVELITQGLRAWSSFYTCSWSHCFTVEQDRVDRGNWRFQRLSLLKTGRDIFHVTKTWTEMICRHVCSYISRTHFPLIKTTRALQCHVPDKQAGRLVQWLISHETAAVLQWGISPHTAVVTV